MKFLLQQWKSGDIHAIIGVNMNYRGVCMELGQKIKAARLELGFSQRQLCDGKITRNMLSQIENGSARPSMDTLAYLARRLGKNVSYFLEEQAVMSPNIAVMEAARQAYAKEDSRKALELLEGYREPDALFDTEKELLRFLCCLHEAKLALHQEWLPYAQAMLEQAAGIQCPYITAPLQRQLTLLQGQAGLPIDPAALCHRESLLLRAQLSADPRRRLEILSACEDRQDPQWHLLTAHAYFQMEDYVSAKNHYLQAEDAFPKETWPKLEHCCRELGDYKGAYEYACKQK